MCDVMTITLDPYELDVLKEIVHEHLARRIEQAQVSCAEGHLGCVKANLAHLECVVEIQRQLEWAELSDEPALEDQVDEAVAGEVAQPAQ